MRRFEEGSTVCGPLTVACPVRQRAICQPNAFPCAQVLPQDRRVGLRRPHMQVLTAPASLVAHQRMLPVGRDTIGRGLTPLCDLCQVPPAPQHMRRQFHQGSLAPSCMPDMMPRKSCSQIEIRVLTLLLPGTAPK